MSSDSAKVTKKQGVNGRQIIDRTPAKPLNKLIKSQLLIVLQSKDIKIKTSSHAGSTTMTVTDSKGNFLFEYDNAWDYGHYSIYIANPQKGAKPIEVANMDWFENDEHTNAQQQDIFDIFDALVKKQRELQVVEEAQKSLTPEEVLALQALGLTK